MASEPEKSANTPFNSEGAAEVYGRTPGAGDWKRITRMVALIVLVVYVILFFLTNRNTIEVSLVVTTVSIPLFWVLMLSFVLGAMVLYLLLYLRKRRVRKRRSR